MRKRGKTDKKAKKKNTKVRHRAQREAAGQNDRAIH